MCSLCVLGSRRGALLVVWWGVTRWAGAAPFGQVVVVVVVEGELVHSTSCAAPFGLGAGKQRRLLSGD